MNILKTFVMPSLLLLIGSVKAQVNIPQANLTYSGTGYTANLTLNGSSVNNVGVGPFKIATGGITVIPGANVPTPAVELAAISNTSLWFCMDPLQSWKVSGVGSDLVYTSTNYVDFNQNAGSAPSNLQNGISDR